MLGGQKFLFWWGRGKGFVLLEWGGGCYGVLKGNLKLHNPIIKNDFRITSVIYFRCIGNTH